MFALLAALHLLNGIVGFEHGRLLSLVLQAGSRPSVGHNEILVLLALGAMTGSARAGLHLPAMGVDVPYGTPDGATFACLHVHIGLLFD